MDRRERILTRVWELLQTIPGIAVCVRNRGELPENMRPALVMLDADEEPDLQHNGSRGQLRAPVVIMALRPQIFAVLQDREPKNEGVGEDLSALRRQILPIILPMVTGDETLRQLVGSNGYMRYEGLSTDMATGRAMSGQMQIHLAFGYPFRLEELTEGV